MKVGKKNWIFCDGYLPPRGDNPDFEGHEALMITNFGKKTAKFSLTLVFEDKVPIVVDGYTLDPMRTMCIRLDQPLGKAKVLIGESVQYTLWLKSNVNVCACFGRLDVRQTNMAYYSVEGYSF
jgi:hypothetical protein